MKLTPEQIHAEALRRSRREFPHVREQVREMYRRDPFYDPDIDLHSLCLDVPSIGDILRDWAKR